MNDLRHITFMLSFSLLTITSSFAIVPTYDISIRNITTHPDPVTGADSILTFDIYLQWTNSADSDPFEFGYCDGSIYINHEVFNGGAFYGLGNAGSFTKILGTSEFPLGNAIITKTSTEDASRDLLAWRCAVYTSTVNFIVRSDYPGTRICTFKVRTNAHSWNIVTPDLRFSHQFPDPIAAGYYPPSTNPENPDDQDGYILTDTIENHFIIENNIPLPVELLFFISSVNRNIVTLNWSTISEINNQGFDLERYASDENHWSNVGFVTGNGTTNGIRNYTFSERLNTGNYYYRLKQIDYNSNYAYYYLQNSVKVGISVQYTLSQNYPNPFNPVTKINYTLPDDADVRIVLYDMTGKEIKVLLDQAKTAGYYTLPFDGSVLPSGVYFYKMTAEGADIHFTDIKKMNLIK